MVKTWLVAKHEYTRHVFRWRFLFVLLSMPAIGAAILAVMIFMLLLQTDHHPVGYVDQAGFITNQDAPKVVINTILQIKYLPFPDEPTARAALEKKDVQAYFVLPKDYRQTLEARLVYTKPPSGLVTSMFENILRLNLMNDQPKAVTRRVINGPRISIETLDKPGGQSVNQLLQSIIPIAVSYLLFGTVVSCSGYLVQSIGEDKENRTMELLATSARPLEIMSGKILGLISVGLTELLFWNGSLLPGIILLVPLVPGLEGSIDWGPIALVLITVPFTFLLICTFIAMMGVMFLDAREGQSAVMLVIIPMMIPYVFIGAMSADPTGPIATGLSLFPITASITLLLRMGFSNVPLWQILTSIGILMLSTIGAFFLSGIVFRKWMLRYGKPIDWKGMIRKIMPPYFKKRAA